MNIFLTGATGFIGQYLVEALRQQPDYRVIAAIRRSVDLPVETRQVGNLDGQTDWQAALQGIDVVVHLAARAHVLNAQEANPEAEFLRVNTAGTINLVEQAIAADVQQFIFISSIGAVASFSEVPLREDDACHPDTPYGLSKLTTEKALVDLASNHAMNWTILRPTLVYGAGNPGNMERLIKLINLGLPLPLGSVQNRRSFLYVENLVDAIATCIQNPKAFGNIFHVSDGQDISTPELIQLIATHTDRRCRLLPVPMWVFHHAGQMGDALEQLLSRQLPINSPTVKKLTQSLVVDNRKICNILDWTPPFTVEAGLRKTFQPL